MPDGSLHRVAERVKDLTNEIKNVQKSLDRIVELQRPDDE
jgi:hypothetical protein